MPLAARLAAIALAVLWAQGMPAACPAVEVAIGWRTSNGEVERAVVALIAANRPAAGAVDWPCVETGFEAATSRAAVDTYHREPEQPFAGLPALGDARGFTERVFTVDRSSLLGLLTGQIPVPGDDLIRRAAVVEMPDGRIGLRTDPGIAWIDAP